MSTNAHSTFRGSRLRVAGAVCFLLAMSSCSRDSTAPTATARQKKSNDVSAQQIESSKSSLSSPEEQVNLAEAAQSGHAERDVPLTSPKEPAIDGQEAEAPGERMRITTEDAMDQPVKRESESTETAVSDYFPLSQGASWRYQLNVLDKNGEVIREATL